VHGAGGAVTLLPYLQDHGDIVSLGLRVGAVAYSSDLRDLPRKSVEVLDDLDVWIVDALRYRDHPTHFSVAQALAWIERIRPRRAILTNLHSDLDYETLRQELPANVEPAFDGMKIIV
jgi:phosphoribosyl 1,2-cyclic phosphate phosphodiesterase